MTQLTNRSLLCTSLIIVFILTVNHNLAHAFEEPKIELQQVQDIIRSKSSNDWSSESLKELGVRNSTDAVYPGLTGEEADRLNQGIALVAVLQACGFQWEPTYHETMRVLRETVKESQFLAKIGAFHGSLQQRYSDNMNVDKICTDQVAGQLSEMVR
jgi:hypothetical protein